MSKVAALGGGGGLRLRRYPSAASQPKTNTTHGHCSGGRRLAHPLIPNTALYPKFSTDAEATLSPKPLNTRVALCSSLALLSAVPDPKRRSASKAARGGGGVKCGSRPEAMGRAHNKIKASKTDATHVAFERPRPCSDGSLGVALKVGWGDPAQCWFTSVPPSRDHCESSEQRNPWRSATCCRKRRP